VGRDGPLDMTEVVERLATAATHRGDRLHRAGRDPGGPGDAGRPGGRPTRSTTRTETAPIPANQGHTADQDTAPR
jgi:hypothetical protein